MIYFATTIKNLRAALDSFAKVCGSEDAPLYDLIQLELIYLNRDGKIVGDEANDYQPKEGEVPGVKIS